MTLLHRRVWKAPARPGPILACALLFLCSAARLPAADWYQWRGPDRTGISAETGLLESWPLGDPPLVWETGDFGVGDGGPVTKGPYLLMQGTVGEDCVLFCVKRETGESVWAIRLDRRYENGNNPGPSSTPTIDGDRVYALSGYGTLVCVRLEDGSLIWSVNLPGDLGGRSGQWGYAESPLVEGDLLIVAPGSAEGTVMALNKMTGERVWASAGLREHAAYTSAIAVDLGEMRTIIHFTSAAGVGIEAATGRVLWRYPAPANRTANASTPLFDKNRVFYASAYGNGGGLLELAPAGDRVLTRQAYFTKQMQNHFGNMVLIDGKIYGASGNILTCMDFATGQVHWRDRSIGKVSVIAAEGRLYLVSDDGKVALAKASPEGYEQLGFFTLKAPPRPTRTGAIISDGRLFIRNVDRLLCYDIRAR